MAGGWWWVVVVGGGAVVVEGPRDTHDNSPQFELAEVGQLAKNRTRQKTIRQKPNSPNAELARRRPLLNKASATQQGPTRSLEFTLLRMAAEGRDKRASRALASSFLFASCPFGELSVGELSCWRLVRWRVVLLASSAVASSVFGLVNRVFGELSCWRVVSQPGVLGGGGWWWRW